MTRSLGWKLALAAIAFAIVVGGVAYRLGHVRADGVSLSSPMTYSGVLENDGQPVDGVRNITLTIWDDPLSTDIANRRCVTLAPTTTVLRGRFSIPLADACADAVRATPDLWIDVDVGGQSLGRTKLGAVPYAVEAGRAAAASGALATMLADHEAQIGSHGHAHGDLTGIGADDHHARYTDSEAVAAMAGATVAGDFGVSGDLDVAGSLTVGGQPAMIFGGWYCSGSGSAGGSNNPLTGAQTCPTGFTSGYMFGSGGLSNCSSSCVSFSCYICYK